MLPYDIALIAACLTLFINYCIGKPGSEFSPYEIFSGYTVWLAKWRLKRIKLYEAYKEQVELNDTDKGSKSFALEKKHDGKIILYQAAEKFFTWERAVGMCPVCTGFWISLIVGLGFQQDFLSMLKIVVVSHITIRILNKVL